MIRDPLSSLMLNLVLLLICLLTGFGLRRLRVVTDEAPRALNQLLVSLFLPALTLLYIPEIRLDQRFLLPVLVPWVQFGMGWLFLGWIARRRALPDRTLGALLLTGGISSTSFVGFPVFELLYGKEGLAMGILMSQAGSFLVCMTLGIAIASWYTAKEPSAGLMLRNMLRFPPFVTFLVAILLNGLGYRHAPEVRSLLEKISSPFSVIALLSVGMQLNGSVRQWQAIPLTIGLSYKLVLAPLLVYALLAGLLRRHDLTMELCVLGAAIGPMNTGAVVAEKYGLNAPLAGQMVGVGLPLSLFVMYLVYCLLH